MSKAVETLKIFASIPANYNASFAYRIVQPLLQMEEQGFPILYLVDDHKTTMEGPGMTNEDRVEAFALAHINLCYQVTSSSLLYNMKTLRAKPPHHLAPGHPWYPPVFVADTDDDVFNCLPLNPAFKNLGWREPDGTPLEDGAEIKVLHPKDGKEVLLWKDGMNGFDLSRNRLKIAAWKELLNRASLVTTSTPRAREYVLREAHEANVFVTPNAINFDEYPNIELADHPGEVRIMWQGSTTHHEDLWPLLDGMKRITDKYPQVTWTFWGAPYQWLYKNLPAERVQIIKWVDYMAYIIRLSTINHDINIAPLRPYPFNQSRSAIKFYESSAICKPAVTLAQRTGEYQDVIIEGETGMLFDTPKQFEEKLGYLIEDSLLRAKMAANAKDWVKTHRDVKVVIPKLYEKYAETWENWKSSLPEPLPYKEPNAKSAKQQRRSRKLANARDGSSKGSPGDRIGSRPTSPASC
jgi:glycosyltransferase involved in cell wall biosynthesis